MKKLLITRKPTAIKWTSNSHHLLDDGGNSIRIEHWWGMVAKTEKFPAICKMALALLSCFHGPQVEGTFNTMGDVIDSKSARINVETNSAIQTVKFHLRAKEKSAMKYFKRKDILHDPVNVRLNKNLKTAQKRHQEVLERKQTVLEEKKRKLSLKAQVQLSKKKARILRLSAERKARLIHRRWLENLAAKKKKVKVYICDRIVVIPVYIIMPDLGDSKL
ncbi:hypothetical protein KUTeg_007882 [Tegillarca granosa]|uniref:Uncharacterized protein n=1 Tax=Tegillarca granosa TaxID=220873 RepID=A0ABQ9FIH8_TEGGR|nr:hypothetical protein KUTeg_007882 [Tegillarca granosa]